MDRVLWPHVEYSAAYLDDVIIHSDTWQQHIQWMAALLGGCGLVTNTAVGVEGNEGMWVQAC